MEYLFITFVIVVELARKNLHTVKKKNNGFLKFES